MVAKQAKNDMNKQIIILIALALMAVGCKKVTVDFTYSPAEPKAGEAVSFTNNSSAGEKWDWNFGDNSSTTSKNPRHTFKKAGTYLVTLRVDSARNQTLSKSITVYDTIPTFVSSTDSITHYTDVTLTANIYNPYSYNLQYQWTLPEHCVLQSGTLTSSAITVYFTTYGQSQTVGLTITQNGVQYPVTRGLYIYETLAPALLMSRTDGTVMRQRLIGDRLEDAAPDTRDEDRQLLAAACDTLVVYNDSVFDLARMQTIVGSPVKRVQMDKMAQKWYFVTAGGLFVANFNGTSAATAVTSIDPAATGALCIDNARNLLYWATPAGLYAMPLVKSMTNKFSTTPAQYNQVTDIERIAFNSEAR